jgi:flagellar motor switch protein FliG
MSMLARYRKPGGFGQLVMLIEGCNPKKQTQLMGLIELEDKDWHHRIKETMLTREKLLAAPSEVTNEVFSRVPDKVLTYVLHAMTPEQREKVMATFNHFKTKAINESLGGTPPSPGDIEAAFMQVFKKVRELEKDRTINFDKYYPVVSLTEKRAA